jgi:alkaline phosphatase
VVTADHGHGLTIAGYPTRGNPILGKVVENDSKGAPRSEPARDDLGLPYTTLGYQNGPGYSGASTDQPEGPKTVPPRGFMGERKGITSGRPNLSGVDTQARDYLQETVVPLQLETHSAEDVPLYAGGPGGFLFNGVQEQSFVYHAIVEALGWNAPPPEAAEPIEYH